MYENYTRQPLPERDYRELLGSSICVFNSNNSFIIENILNTDSSETYNWYDLIDQTSGKLRQAIKPTISRESESAIADLFDDLVGRRNRIVHSFQVTNDDGEQILRTKDRLHKQFDITREFLLKFIEDNERLSNMLHDFRGY